MSATETSSVWVIWMTWIATVGRDGRLSAVLIFSMIGIDMDMDAPRAAWLRRPTGEILLFPENLIGNGGPWLHNICSPENVNPAKKWGVPPTVSIVLRRGNRQAGRFR
ncbi:MAG: hypothetical protein AMXMBFR83_06890 [Phycisphaerae bacterium]